MGVVYIGTTEYSGMPSTTIHCRAWDAGTGAIGDAVCEPVEAGPNPTFLCLSPDGMHLYCTVEAGNHNGVNGQSAVIAFAVDAGTGRLTRLGAQDSCGKGCCHVSLDVAGTTVFVANYGSGSVAVFPRSAADGSIGPASDSKQAAGELDPALSDRQEGPHAHMIRLDWSQQWALVPDLGLDTVFVYRFDPTAGSLQGAQSAARHYHAARGAGPRHLEFNAEKRTVYLLNELDATVDVLDFDVVTGSLSKRQTVAALPEGTTPNRAGHMGSADIHLLPSGKYLYCSNRTDSSLTVFAVGEDGTLTVVSNISTGGKIPRNFTLSPDGTKLLVANQESSNVVVFSIDQGTGELRRVAEHALDCKPVCLVLVA